MSLSQSLPPLEMWGGLECTVNRVGNTYFDQLERNGHINRPSDIQRFAELGMRMLRYPIQWERIAPDGIEQANWSWADERLNLLRSVGITPIVGLIHHGSGPRSTSLVEPSFVEGFTQFAEAVARRYPWVEHYTPVNEPLTTARFSGLYGLWYPHARNHATFARILLNQCRATALAMQAIRRINPSAQLIQNEDIGKTFSTPLLAELADWDNERRWLTFDLLCGRLDRDHLMWNFLIASGVQETELEWFLEHPCPPDILGIDYYVTSERFFDEHLDRYPVELRTENKQYKYVDVEAVRVNTGSPLPLGYYERMKETWERYHIPMAITEAHLGCTREEQLRWLVGAWSAAQALREEGVSVRAVTAWSLLGAFDWNSLVTRVTDFYEPGVFDVRGPHPRPTALAGVMRTLAAGKMPDHPVLAQTGWWKRSDRFFYQSYLENISSVPTSYREYKPIGQERPLLILEAGNSALGEVFARFCNGRCLPYQLVTQQEMDASDAFAIHMTLKKLNPWAVISLAGSGSMQDETSDAEHLDRKYVRRASILADVCAQRNIPLVAFSSDLVFDGTRQKPYVESDPVTPVSARGRMQAEMEEQILRRCPSALVIRTGPLFSPWENSNFAMTSHSIEGHSTSAVGQMMVSPTYVPDLVDACLDLMIDEERGRWHLANGGAMSWSDFAQRLGDSRNLRSANNIEDEAATRHAADSHIHSRALQSERGQLLPTLDNALSRYLWENKREQEQLGA